MKYDKINRKKYIEKLHKAGNCLLSFKENVPEDAELTITKLNDSYIITASYKKYDVNFKNFGMALDGDVWKAKVIAAKHAVNLVDVLIREIARAKKLLKIGDLVNLKILAAKWDTKFINDLSDAAFAYIKPGGKKDSEGKTVPRSLRMLPHHTMAVKNATENTSVDKVHLRNALARVNQPGTILTPEQRSSAKGHLDAHARALKIGKYSSSLEEKIKKVLVELREKWEKGAKSEHKSE